MTPTSAPVVPETSTPGGARDRYVDALRAGALMVVVFGHWLATLPIERADGHLDRTAHLLDSWAGSAWLTWALQVVPLFVFVSAAVNGPSLARARDRGDSFASWFRDRLHGLSRPVAMYLSGWFIIAAVIWLGKALEVKGAAGSWRVLSFFNQSLTIHLWFIAMIVAMQLLLPFAIRLDRKASWRAVVALLVAGAIVDALRFFVFDDSPLAGLPNAILIWMVPQQLGVLWARATLTKRHGALFVALGLGGLVAGVLAGYPIALVGGDIGDSNVVPPTLMIAAVSLMQAGLVILLAKPARATLRNRSVWGTVQILGAVGMPLYLWHKTFEPFVASVLSGLGAIGLVAGASPAEPGFWLHRATWIGLLLIVTVPFAMVQLRKAQRERAAKRTAPPAPAQPPAAPGRVWAAALTVIAAVLLAIVAGVTKLPQMAIATAGMWAAVTLTRPTRLS